MLVLTRRAGESIMIGDDVTVTILEMRGDQIRVGIDAPRHVKVNREEVLRNIERTNNEAVTSAARARAYLQRRPVPAAPPSDDNPSD